MSRELNIERVNELMADMADMGAVAEATVNELLRASNERERIQTGVQHWINWFIGSKPCLPMHDYTRMPFRRDFTSLIEAITLMFHDIENENVRPLDNDNIVVIMNGEHFMNLRRDADNMEGITYGGGVAITMRLYGIKIAFNVHMPREYIIVLNRSSLHIENPFVVTHPERNGLIHLHNIRGYAPRNTSRGNVNDGRSRLSNINFLRTQRRTGSIDSPRFYRENQPIFSERIGLQARRPEYTIG